RSALASLLSHPLPRHLFPVDFAANLISIRSRRTRISTLFPYTTLFRSHQGYARFGMLDEGDSFSVLEKQNNEEVILNDFVCDGRNEYIVQVNRRIKIQLLFKNSEGQPFPVENYSIQTKEIGSKSFSTNNAGELDFSLDVDSVNFSIYNEKGEK